MLAWGDPGAPKLFCVHGWMDVAASFQFLVDAFERHRDRDRAPPPRIRRLLALQPQGYWFADYLADLEALIDAYAPDANVSRCGHSLGGNVTMLYAGIRPDRVRRAISLDGFGIPMV